MDLYKIIVIGGDTPQTTKLHEEAKKIGLKDTNFFLVKLQPLVEKDADGDIVIGRDSGGGKARNITIFKDQALYYTAIEKALADPNAKNRRWKSKDDQGAEIEMIELAGLKISGEWVEHAVPDGYIVLDTKTGKPRTMTVKIAEGKYEARDMISHKVVYFRFEGQNELVMLTAALKRIEKGKELLAKKKAVEAAKQAAKQAEKNAKETPVTPETSVDTDADGNPI